LVAVADKRVDAVERDAVVHYIKERMRAPGLTGPSIVNLFDECARHLQEQDFLDVAIEAFRPVQGMSFSSDVIEIAERVAAADGHVHLSEQRAVRLLRLLAIVSDAEGVASFSDCYEMTRFREYLRRRLGVP
jgi:tellurite resistance protein